MAIYKCSEFAELCGIGKNTIAIYASRGKIVRSGEKGKYIDTSIPENALFLDQKRKEKGFDGSTIPLATEVLNKKVRTINKAKERNNKKNQPIVNVEPVVQYAKPGPINPESIKPDPEAQKVLRIKRQQEQAKLDQISIGIQKTELEIQQKLGKILPTEIVKIMVKQLGHSFAMNYRTGAEQIIEVICRKYHVVDADRAEYKTNLVHIINDVHDRAIKQTKTGLQKMIEEQTVVKNVDDSDLEE